MTKAVFLTLFALLPCLTRAAGLPAWVTNNQGDAGVGRQAERSVIHLNDGQLTLYVRDVLLLDVLQEIARQGGFQLVFYGDAEQRVSIHLQRTPLAVALERVLGRRGFALAYEGEAGGGFRALTKLWVLSREGGSRAMNARSPGAGSTRIRHLRFAGQSKTEGLNSSVVDPENVVSSLEQALLNPDPGVRETAVDAAGASSLSEVVPSLKKALQDTDALVRKAAAEALAEVGDQTSLEALGHTLLDEDAWVREAGIEGLVAIGGNGAVRLLAQALTDDDNWIREEAIEGLGKIGGETAMDVLEQALMDEESSLRIEAVEALGKIGGARSIRMLEAAMADEDDAVRENATELLEQLRWEAAM